MIQTLRWTLNNPKDDERFNAHLATMQQAGHVIRDIQYAGASYSVSDHTGSPVSTEWSVLVIYVAASAESEAAA